MNKDDPLLADDRQPTTIAGYSLAIAKALQHYGVDSEPLLLAAGIPAAVRNDPMIRLSVSQLTDLYRRCVEATGDPYFGLTVARFIHISNMHALGHALAASANLLDFCQRLERYFRIASQTAVPSVSLDGAEGTLSLKLVAPLSGETQDAFVGFLILAMRQLYKPEFCPLRVGLSRPQPGPSLEPYEKLFRVPVSFERPEISIVIARHDLEQPLAGACAELAQMHDEVAARYLARLDKDDVVAQVRHKIIEFLPNGNCGRNRVAAALCMSPATLQLKLAQREASFQSILEDTRKELACAYLQSESRPITEVAFMLGFTDTSNFTRAFRRWTGQSPSAYRRQSGIDPPDAR